LSGVVVDDRAVLERLLDRPERMILGLPWPSDIRIILKGSLGFLRQVARSRVLGLRSRPATRS
jgi:hypothetical protein